MLGRFRLSCSSLRINFAIFKLVNKYCLQQVERGCIFLNEF